MADMAATRITLRETLGPAYDQPIPGLENADPARGKIVYDSACASCHGASGKGDGPAAAGLEPPPGDLTDAFHSRFYSDAGRIHIVRKGLPGTAMGPFEGVLSQEETLDVYGYVKGLIPAATVPAAGPEHDHSKHDH